MHKSINISAQNCFVIGDIHGTISELNILLNYLKDLPESQKAHYIFIGDYINRGKHSKEVIESLITWQSEFENCIFLKGNHEEMLLGFLGFPSTSKKAFFKNAGAKTFASYGITEYENIEKIKEQLPEEHLKFFLELDSMAISDDYVFVHAGLAPLVELDHQKPEDFLWIREEFINNIHRFNKTVIFGHTPFKDVYLHLPYKIGIDTGLAFGNMLSCIELSQGLVLQVKAGTKSVLKRSL